MDISFLDCLLLYVLNNDEHLLKSKEVDYFVKNVPLSFVSNAMTVFNDVRSKR